MKKNILKHTLIALALLSGLFQSCRKNILETIPDDRISSAVFWKTEADARLGVNAIYTSLDAINLFVLDGITDIGHTNTVFTAEYAIESGAYDATHSRVQAEWTSAYRGIFLANDVLENIGRVQSTNTALMLTVVSNIAIKADLILTLDLIHF
jgi:hypothetical protein